MSSSGHGHGHGSKAIAAAFCANLGIAVAKLIGFFFTRSSSMLAEAVHSLADTGNQGLLLFGGRRSARVPDETHPFGYGTERYFWAFVVALVLFLGGAAFAIFEGVEKILRPHDLESPIWAIAILGIAIVLEAFSFRAAIVGANAMRGSQSLMRFIRTSRSPEIPVLLLEDFGALVGLALALSGVLLTLATDNAVFDGIGTLSIGILLAVLAVVLAAEMKSLLIGESALPEDQQAIAGALRAGDGVCSVIHLRTLHIGPEELLVAAKLEFAPELDLAGLAMEIDHAEARVRAAIPAAKLIYLEPDLLRPRQ